MKSSKSYSNPFEVQLLSKWRDFVFLLCICAICLVCSLSLEYLNYKDLRKNKTIELEARVILQYKKNDYFVLKLRSNNHNFYTTSRDDLRDLRGRYIRIYGALGKNCSFKDYMKSCFITS